MFKTTRRTAVFAATVLVAAGCSKPNPIIGKWRTTAPAGEPGAPPQQVDMVFDDKGDEKMTQQVRGVTLTVDSSYKAENGQLSQTLKSAQIGSMTLPVSGQSKVFQYKIDGDTMTLTSKSGNGNMVFTRLKE
jgi:hypothetical protein